MTKQTASARERLDRAVSEREFQAQVRALALYGGWWVFHAYDSRRSQAGWPDLALVKPGRDGQPGRLILAELKSEHGRLTTEQRVWLHGLRTVPGIEVYEWRPSQWDAVIAALQQSPVAS